MNAVDIILSTPAGKLYSHYMERSRYASELVSQLAANGENPPHVIELAIKGMSWDIDVASLFLMLSEAQLLINGSKDIPEGWSNHFNESMANLVKIHEGRFDAAE
jgi:hypothetical protein